MKKEKYNILYVDDELSNIRIFKAIFDRHYNVYTAESGAEGIKLLEQYPIRLIITDQRMPYMTGLEFLRKVKLKWKNIKSIILSAYSDIDVVKSAINDIEIFRYVNKPFDHKDMKMLIDLALELHQSKIDNKKESDILHSRAEKFYGIFKSIGDVFTRVNNDGFVEIISPSVYDLVGYKPEEVIGKKPLNYYVNKEDRNKLLQKTKEKGFCNNFETAIYTKDKKIVHVLVSSRIHTDQYGTPLGIDSLVRDVTEFKLQQKVLAENELKLRNFFDIAPVGIALSDMQGRYIEVNRQFSQFTGYSIDELNKLSPWELTPEEYAVQEQEQLDSLANNNKYGPYNKEYIHKKGHRYPVLLNGVKTKGQNREELIWSVVQDISEQRKAEETIKNQRERLVLATRAANLGVWDWDVVNDILIWDDSMYNLYRINKGDFIGAFEAWTLSLHPDDREISEAEVKAALLGHKNFNIDFRIVWPDQSVRHIHAEALVIRDEQGAPIRMIGVNWDITETKEAKEMLEALGDVQATFIAKDSSKIPFDDLLDILLNITVSEYGFIGEIQGDQNKEPFLKALATTDISRNKETSDFHKKKDLENLEFKNFKTFFGKVITTGKPVISNNLHKDELSEGNPYMRSFMGIPFYNNNELIGIVGVANRPGGYDDTLIQKLEPVLASCSTLIAANQNIIKERKAQKELLESKSQKQLLFETAMDAIISTDSNQKIISVNRAAAKMFGYKIEELIGKPLNLLIPKEKRKGHPKHIKKFEKGNENSLRMGGSNAIIYGLTSSGKKIPIETSLSKQAVNGGFHFHAFIRDISERIIAEEERKESESRLKEAQRIAQVGHWNLDLVNNKLHWSDEIYRILDSDSQKSNATYENFLNFIHPSDREMVDKAYTNSLITKKPYEITHRVLLKDGTIKYVNEKCVSIFDKNGKAIHSTGTMQDITERKKVEIELRKNKQNLQLIYDSTAEVLFQLKVEPNNRFVFLSANKAFLASTGLNEEQLIGKTTDEIIPEPSHTLVLKKYKKAIKERKAVKWEETTVFPSGKRIGDVTITPAFDDDRNCTHLIGTVYDITEIKDALEEIKKLNEELEERVLLRTEELIQEKNFSEVLINSLPGIFSLIDKNGNHIRWNKNHEKVTGYSPEEYKHLNAFDFFSKTNKKIFSETFLKLRGKNEMNLEINLLTKKGSVIPYFFTGLNININNKKYLSSMGIDISERKLLEEELLQSKEEADKANRAKSDFLANMSHEIRTPMNAILGFSEILSKQIKNPTQIEYLTSIRSSGKTLLELINNILDLSKIESGKLDFSYEPLNIKMFVQEIVGMFKVKCEEKNLSMNVILSEELPDILFIEELRMKQILINLINNAIKFTEKGYIEIEVATQNIVNKSLDLVLRVKDTGIGIPKKFHKKIFKAFDQIDTLDNKKYEGTGLGLTITQQLVKQMKGNITVESSVGKGSIFTVILKKVEISKEKTQLERRIEFDSDSIQFDNPTVLIVDDIKSNRDVLKGYMMGYKINCIEAENGREAIVAIKKNKPDLVFLDLRMPIMDGYETNQLIKKNPDWSTIPIVAVTASAFEKDEKKVLELGFSEYLSKPVGLNEILKILMKSLKHNIIDINKEDIAEITYKPIDKLDDVLMEIGNKVMPVWEELKTIRKKKKVHLFVKLLLEIGKKYSATPLINYGNELLLASNSFNIDKELKLIQQFPDFVIKLSFLEHEK